LGYVSIFRPNFSLILDHDKGRVLRTGSECLGDDNLDEAINLYNKALELDPQYQDALHGLGMAFLNHGKLEEAAQTARRLIEIDNDDVLAHTSLSMIYHAQDASKMQKKKKCSQNPGLKEELKKAKTSQKT
jgi:tetratricopeptide (TPR) repeat protein